MSLLHKNFVTVDIGFRNLALCFWENSKIREFSLVRLVEEKASADKITSELAKVLSNFTPMLSQIAAAYVERQLCSNIKATRIEAQMHMWFKIHMPHVKYVPFSPAAKYKQCDRTEVKTKSQRKKWAADYAARFIPAELSQKYAELEKKDDVGDCVLIGLAVIQSASRVKVAKHNK